MNLGIGKETSDTFLIVYVMPISHYLEIQPHVILRSIQEIIKMHAFFYVDGVGERLYPCH